MPEWEDRPYCGAEYPGPVAGAPVVCGRESHDDSSRHRHEESGFEWWSFQTYPRS